jgi:hypothetical protein
MREKETFRNFEENVQQTRNKQERRDQRKNIFEMFAESSLNNTLSQLFLK